MTTIGPLAADVDFDGDIEVFASSEGRITCIDGETGNLIWQYKNSISSHSPFEINNIDNEKNLELVISCYGRTIALNAEDGSVDWVNHNVSSMEKHPVILNVGGKTYVYVTCNFQDNPDSSNTGLLWKLDGVDGSVVKQVSIGYPCWGGLSAADVDGDGGYELFLTDRSKSNDYPLDRGMQCYDADTLDLIWFVDDITCSSHCQAIVDVDGDGVLDSVAFNQGGGGVYVVDGSTGAKMPGKCENRLGLTGHSQFSVYDVDLDGNLELVTVWNKYDWVNPTKVWDLGSWSLDATLDVFAEPPRFADVMGDSRLEIIGGSDWKRNPDVGGTRGVKIYDSNYDLIYTLYERAISSTLVQDIDNDGLNELIIISSDGVLKAYDTLAITPNPRIATNSLYYGTTNIGACVYSNSINDDSDINYPPMISNNYPVNFENNFKVRDTNLNVKITDNEGDKITWSIETNPNIGSITGFNETNGTKSCSISGLNYSTNYKWFVNATDGKSWTRKSFTFTTGDKVTKKTSSSSGFSGSGSNGDPDNESNIENSPPNQPILTGPSNITIGEKYSYSVKTSDIDNDQIRFKFNWGNNKTSNWTKYMDSNTTITINNSWYNKSIVNISVIAQDINGYNSSPSNPLMIIINYDNQSKTDNNQSDSKNENIKISTKKMPVRLDANNILNTTEEIVNCEWNLGDGTKANKTILDHNYTNPGEYNVSIKANDTTGNEYYKKIEVVYIGDIQQQDSTKNRNNLFLWLFLLIFFIISLCLFLFFIFKKYEDSYEYKKYIKKLGNKLTNQTNKMIFYFKNIGSKDNKKNIDESSKPSTEDVESFQLSVNISNIENNYINYKNNENGYEDISYSNIVTEVEKILDNMEIKKVENIIDEIFDLNNR